jgi:DNA N-6-adenine-methyltransferase (Dam)
MNPPYGRGRVTDRWVRKAYEASKTGATVVCLLKVATSSERWKTYVLPYARIKYLDKRLKFGRAAHNAPFDSAVVIFRPHADGGVAETGEDSSA